MTDFLARLAGRTLALLPVAQPRPRSMFEGEPQVPGFGAEADTPAPAESPVTVVQRSPSPVPAPTLPLPDERAVRRRVAVEAAPAAARDRHPSAATAAAVTPRGEPRALDVDGGGQPDEIIEPPPHRQLRQAHAEPLPAVSAAVSDQPRAIAAPPPTFDAPTLPPLPPARIAAPAANARRLEQGLPDRPITGAALAEDDAVVRISIGRIDVHASPVEAAEIAPPHRSSAMIGLDEYLRRSSRRRS